MDRTHLSPYKYKEYCQFVYRYEPAIGKSSKGPNLGRLHVSICWCSDIEWSKSSFVLVFPLPSRIMTLVLWPTIYPFQAQPHCIPLATIFCNGLKLHVWGPFTVFECVYHWIAVGPAVPGTSYLTHEIISIKLWDSTLFPFTFLTENQMERQETRKVMTFRSGVMTGRRYVIPACHSNKIPFWNLSGSLHFEIISTICRSILDYLRSFHPLRGVL